MKPFYLLEEVESLTTIPANTLRTRLNRGELIGIKVPKKEGGSRQVWALLPDAVEMLKSGAPKENIYSKVMEQWKNEQRAGYRCPEPLKENTIQRKEFGLLAFWDFLDGVKPCEKKDIENRRQQFGKEQSFERLTIANIMTAISKVPKANAPTRENIYKSTMSLYRSLVHQGLRPETDLLRFKEFRPAPNKRPRRTSLKDAGEFESLLLTNQSWYGGRTSYDRLLTDILLRITYLTGMRASEICNLELKDVDFHEQIIYVWKSKHDKDRKIGIDPELLEPLKVYMGKRPESSTKRFFLRQCGLPLNRKAIWGRIKKVAEKAGLDLTPHGMRRSLITKLLMEGAPPALVQKLVGHNNLATTQKYDMSTDEDALDLLRKRRASEFPRALVGVYEF